MGIVSALLRSDDPTVCRDRSLGGTLVWPDDSDSGDVEDPGSRVDVDDVDPPHGGAEGRGGVSDC